MTKKPPSATTAYAIGLRWALFFLLSFFILGYSALFSIALGIVGGVTTGMMFTWWHTKDELPAKTAAEVASEESDRDRRIEKSLNRAERWKRQGRVRQGGPSLKSLKWPFRRR